MGDIKKAVNLIVQIANDDTHGYAQDNRYGPDYDCSSLVSHVLHEAGFNISIYSTTRDLVPQLLREGFKSVPLNSVRKAGDIFIHTANHVIMCINENQVAYASINERGTVSGGQAGDQTGKEIKINNFYTPSYGWEYHLTYTDDNTTSNENIVVPAYPDTPLKDMVVEYGDIGNIVKVLQSLLIWQGYDVGRCGIDGEYGNDTMKALFAFKQSRNYNPTTIVNTKVWELLINE